MQGKLIDWLLLKPASTLDELEKAHKSLTEILESVEDSEVESALWVAVCLIRGVIEILEAK